MSTNMKLMTATELMNSTSRETTAAHEGGYRRGYTHGYSQAMDDIKRVYGESNWRRSAKLMRAWQTLAQFFDGRLMRWRGRSTSSESIPPQIGSGEDL